MKKIITRRNFLKKSSKFVAAAGLGGCGILLKGLILSIPFSEKFNKLELGFLE
jgi:hypothetical protein